MGQKRVKTAMRRRRKKLIYAFDDKKSFIHTIAGGLTVFFPPFFIIFIFYEIIEHIYKHGKEETANFLGDIIEFLFGLGAVYLFVALFAGNLVGNTGNLIGNLTINLNVDVERLIQIVKSLIEHVTTLFLQG